MQPSWNARAHGLSASHRYGIESLDQLQTDSAKARDRTLGAVTTEWDRAKAFYYGTQKKSSKTKAQEGTDYFATPEPIGLKMVQMLDLRGGESALEPSAGHGAIARWIQKFI